MAKYRECLNCVNACYTSGLKGYAEHHKKTLESQNAIYCLLDRNYHGKIHACKSYEERAEKLVY